MNESTPRIRPTIRCLQDLGIKLPAVEVRLDDLDHLLIRKAQSIPDEATSGGAQRVLSLNDRLWFKVKTSSLRGVVTQLGRGEVDDAFSWARWWIGAAGERRQDSADDFYRKIEAAAQRAGRGSGRADTSYLLPQADDWARLRLESAVEVVLAIRQVVGRTLANSLRTGHAWSAELTGHRLTALARAEDGEAYLAVCAEGFVDPKILATILSAVPLMTPSDWLPEPNPHFGITPSQGQIIFSAMISTESQDAVLEAFPAEE